MNLLSLFARQELVLALRSRSVQVFAVVFGGLALLVAASGYLLSGGHGVQDFARTAASLIQLVLLLVPLTALSVGVFALAPERGAAEILFAQPVARRTILWGKLLGLFQALAAAQALGFGVAGLVVFARAGSAGLAGYAAVVCGSLALTAIFLGLAAWIAVGSIGRPRTRALAIALGVWFVGVVLFDVATLGVASLLGSGAASRLLSTSVLVNPVAAVRTAVLFGVEGTAAFGAASLAFLRFTGGPAGAGALLGGSLVFWLLAPPLLAIRSLGRADL